MTEELKAKLKEKLLEYVFKGIGVAVPFISLLIPYERFDPRYLFGIVVMLATICFVLIGYIISKRPKDMWLPELGIWKEAKSGHYICPSCKANNKRVPMKEDDKGWACQVEEKYMAFKPGQEPKSEEKKELKAASASSPPESRRRLISKGIESSWINRWR